MDFKGLIEFNKYTVAIAAGCFIYTLEKFVPTPTEVGRIFVLILLLIFLASAILGVAIFAASTGALHGTPARREQVEKLIPPLGIGHAVLLCVGMVLLGGMLYSRVMAAPGPIGCL
jgi:hypothetical protein